MLPSSCRTTCLFADQAGEVFEILMEDCNLHTVLRLPARHVHRRTAAGTKTNVVFFTKGEPTETHLDLRRPDQRPRNHEEGRPLTPEHFAEFEKCFGADPNGCSKRKTTDSKDDRWRSFHIEEVKARDYKIDSLKWLRDESLDDMDDLPEPEELATDAISELEAAVLELNSIIKLLENGNGNGKAGAKAIKI